nr:DNA repair protein RecO [uncultured Sellimonas sp.]
MNQTITVTGMILSAIPIGEYDKRIVILSRERGKISAFARGARKPGSMLMGTTNPFVFGTFSLYEGRSSYTLKQTDIQNYFGELLTDIEAAYYGFYFLEFADYCTRENNDETEILKLLYQTMRIVVKRSIPLQLIRYIFELKIISLGGEAPRVFECSGCGKTEDIFWFSARKGGLLCGGCQGKAEDAIPVQKSTVYALQFIVATPVEKLYTFTVSGEVLSQLSQVSRRYMDVYVGHHFKSMDMLKLV